MKERNKTNRRKENKKYNILKKYIFFIYIKEIYMIVSYIKKFYNCARENHIFTINTLHIKQHMR